MIENRPTVGDGDDLVTFKLCFLAKVDSTTTNRMVERDGKSLHEILEKLVKGTLKERLETVPSNFNQDLNGGSSSFYRFVVKGWLYCTNM